MDQELNIIEGTARADFLRGSWQADLILAGAGNDLILARGGNDIVDAGDGNDRVFAGSGDDLVKTGLGRDFADGGSGVDTAQFDGDSSDYRITSFFGLTFVTDLRTGETDTLTRFEFLKFDDGLFDINGSPVDTNEDPEAVDDEAETAEDTLVTIDVLANDSDADGDTLTVTEAAAANGEVNIWDDGTLAYTPDENFSGEDTITYTVSDGNGGTSTATVKVLVGGVADAPSLAAPDTLETLDRADIELSGIVAGLADTDGSETLSIKFTGLPIGAMILNPREAELREKQISNLAFRIEALEPEILQLQEEIRLADEKIAIIKESDPDSDQIAAIEAEKAGSEQRLAEKVAEKQQAEAGLAEAESELSTFKQEAGPDGMVEFDAPLTGLMLRLPETTIEDFTLGVEATATESEPLASPADRTATTFASVDIIVGESPTAEDDTATTAEDTPVTIKVLGNDQDSDGDVLSVVDVIGVSNGFTVVNDDGSITFTPDPDFSGETEFSYTITDGKGGVSGATVKVLVGGVADDPTLELPDALSTIDLAPIALDDINASLNDQDGSESLSVKFRGLPNGAVIAKAIVLEKVDQILVLNEEISDIERLIVETEPEIEAINQALEAADENTPPEEIDDLLSRKQQLTSLLSQAADEKAFKENARNELAAEVQALLNETDPDGNIEIDDFGDGFILVLPKGTVDNLQIKIDATATESQPLAGPEFETATVSKSLLINVLETLEAQDDAAATPEDTPVTVFATANDVGENPQVSSAGPANNGTVGFNDDGDLVYTPDENFSGVDTFEYTAIDDFGATSTATVQVTVGGVADQPNLWVPETLETTDLAPISLNDIVASLVDTDGSESLKLKLGGLPVGSVISNPARIGGLTGLIEVFQSDIDRNNAQKTQFEADLAEVIPRIDDLRAVPDPTQDQLEELAALEQAQQDLETNLQKLQEDRTETEARIDKLVADREKLTQEAGPDGHVEIEDFGAGFVLRLPDGVIDGFKLSVEAVATEADPFNEETRTAGTLGEVDVSVQESPVANDDETSTAEDTAVTISPAANDTDSDGDSLTIVGTTDGANGEVIINADGTVTYTPKADYSGDDQFTYTIEDPDGNSSTATVSVVVNGVADVPTLFAPASLQTIDLADIDLGGIRGQLADTDGSETLLIRFSGLPQGSVVANPQAIADLNDEGNGLAATIKVLQTDVRNNQELLSERENELRDLLVSGTATEDQIAAKRQEIEDLARQISNDNREIESANNRLAEIDAELGSLTLRPDIDGVVGIPGETAGWVLQLPAGSTENFSFDVEAVAIESDPVAGNEDRTAASEKVSIFVGVRESSRAEDDSAQTDEDTPIDINVLANDLGDSNAPVDVVDVSEPTNGAVQINANGTITYTPFDDFNGSDTFTYTIEDEIAGQSTATVNVTVTPVNDPPEGAPALAGTPEVGQTLIANPDPINDPDGIRSIDQYVWQISADGIDNWEIIVGAVEREFEVPPEAEGKFLRVEVLYTDGGGKGENAASLPTAAVAPAANQDPIAESDNGQAAPQGFRQIIDVLENDSDPDGDPLTIVDVSTPASGEAGIETLPDGSQLVTYTPDPDFFGTDSFTYDISDGNGGTATATVTVNVSERQVVDPPDDGEGPVEPPIIIPPIDPPDDGGGRPPGDGGGRPPPGVIVPTPILPNPIDPGRDSSNAPFDGVLSGTSDSDVFVSTQGDGAISVLGFQQATSAAAEVADQIQLDGFGLAFADLDSNGDGQVGIGDAGVSGGGVASLAVDFGGGDVLSVNGVSFLTEDDLLFV